MWTYVYAKSLKGSMIIVPTPLHYFTKENFMLYHEFQGHTLRDYAHDYLILKKISPHIGKNLAWWHSLPLKKQFEVRTETFEKKYWDSVERKIERYLPKKNKTKKLKDDLAYIYTKQKQYYKKPFWV